MSVTGHEAPEITACSPADMRGGPIARWFCLLRPGGDFCAKVARSARTLRAAGSGVSHPFLGLRSAGRKGEDHRPVLQPPLVGDPEVEPGGVHVLEQPLPSAGYDRHDPEVELVDQVISYERVVEAAGAVFDEVLAGLVLQPGDRAGWVGPKEGGIPCRLGQ